MGKGHFFIPIPKEGNAKKKFQLLCSFHMLAMLYSKSFKARFQKYVNRELPDVQVGFQRGRGIRDKIANVCWIMDKARKFQKNTYFSFIDYAEAFVWIITNWKIPKEMGVPNHLTCLLRNLYVSQEATVRTRHGKMDWFKIGKGVW